MTPHRVAIVWLRRTLRLADNPALMSAIADAETVVPVFIIEDGDGEPWAPGGASVWWRERSLEALEAALTERGSGLVVRAGEAISTLRVLAAEVHATAVYMDRRYEPRAAAADNAVITTLERDGLRLRSFNCSLINEPDSPRTAAGGPFRVFTAYLKACARLPEGDPPLHAPERIDSPPEMPQSIDYGTLAATSGKVPAQPDLYWAPGENDALAHASRFFAEAAEAYETNRDRPDRFGTSRLSPHLAFGEIGPRQLLAAARRLTEEGAPSTTTGVRAFIRQLYWREFAYHLLHHFPQTTERPLRPEFEAFPWVSDPAAIEAWMTGQTGYPIVDAGMRELLATGWMHNRVRMIVASFLTKDLLLPWQEGARYFWEHLVDADLANNTFGWQWVAGSGADAAPYFRVFNPVLQGEKHDPEGAYVRAWVPELARLPNRWLHRPWEAPAATLCDAGVSLRETYPAPIVDHREARRRARAAYASMRAEATANRAQRTDR